MKRRLLAILLTICLVVSLAPAALAAEAAEGTEVSYSPVVSSFDDLTVGSDYSTVYYGGIPWRVLDKNFSDGQVDPTNGLYLLSEFAYGYGTFWNAHYGPGDYVWHRTGIFTRLDVLHHPEGYNGDPSNTSPTNLGYQASDIRKYMTGIGDYEAVYPRSMHEHGNPDDSGLNVSSYFWKTKVTDTAPTPGVEYYVKGEFKLSNCEFNNYETLSVTAADWVPDTWYTKDAATGEFTLVEEAPAEGVTLTCYHDATEYYNVGELDSFEDGVDYYTFEKISAGMPEWQYTKLEMQANSIAKGALYVAFTVTDMKESTSVDTEGEGRVILSGENNRSFASDMGFSELEQEAVLPTSRVGYTNGAARSPSIWTYKNSGAYSDELVNDTYFLPSAADLNTYLDDKGISKATTYANGDRAQYWLSSMTRYDRVAMTDGNGGEWYQHPTMKTLGIRPAFNLNPDAVLFYAPVNDVAFGAVSDNGDNAYKLVLKDGERDDFFVGIAYEDNTARINYYNAKTGTNEYISAVVLDGEGEIVAYGQVAKVAGANGVATLDLTGIDMDGKTLYIFNEQCNGEDETNYASEPQVSKVAAIGNTPYGTLQDAIAAAEDGGTVKLIGDVTATVMPTADTTNNPANCLIRVDAGKKVTLDLNGCTVAVTGDAEAQYDTLAIRNHGDLTITDTSADKDGKITFSYEGTKEYLKSQIHSTILNFGTLTVEAGAIENTATTGYGRYAIYSYAWGGNANVTVKGGTITNNTSVAIYADGYSDFGTNSCNLTIEDGVLNGGVWYNGQTTTEGKNITISGGTFNAGTNAALTIKNTPYTAIISGGTFNGEVSITEGLKPVTGGTFAVNPSAYVAEDYAAVQEGGKYVVTSAATAVTGVTLNKNTLSLTSGNTAQMVATVTVADEAASKAVTWSSSNTSVATVDANGKVTAVAAGTAIITATTVNGKTATCTVTVSTPVYDDGGSYTPPASTTTPNTNSPTVSTETKTDATTGSTTVTETKKDGTTVETTTNADGSSTTTASKTEVKETATGTTTTTTTNNTTVNADGTKTTSTTVEKKVETATGTTTTTNTTTKEADGTTTKAETVEKTTTDKTTGEEVTTSTTKTTSTNGSSSTTTVAADGTTTAEVKVSSTAVNNAAKADEPVTLPMPEVAASTSTATAPAVEVDVPSNAKEVTVEIPVADVTAGTVAVIVHADGTEEIVKTSTITENGVAVKLEGDATIKVVDNSKDFIDVADDYSLSDSIDFVSARGLFEGTTEITFEPHDNTTVAQTMTVLARLSGEDFYGAGSTTKGAEWAAEKGLDDGTPVQQAITREQMVVMMWKLAGSPESDHPLNASDVNEISTHAVEAMQWAVEMGILKGNLDGTIDPHGNASRAHVAAFAERYVNAIN